MRHFLLFTLGIFISSCSIKKMAVKSFADALTDGSATVYAMDDDPDLVGEALPFALKTIESLLQTVPEHQGLLLAAASGFVQYAHAYVLRSANPSDLTNLSATRKAQARAKRLFLRARNYGLRALEINYSGIAEALQIDAGAAVSKTKKADVPALYWTGVAIGSAISVAKDDMALVGDLPTVEALLRRALELDESWQDGAIHEFFITFAAGRTEAEGGGLSEAQSHFERAMELSNGKSISPLVTFAEAVCVQQQDRQCFRSLLAKALEFDADKFPQTRLANLLAQRKASELLNNIDDLFFIEESFQEGGPQKESALKK